jgi:hypothetical protein
MKPKLSDQLVVPLEPELRREIEAAADQDRRPLGNLVRCILADWAETRRREQGEGARA